ncbi:MAG: 8-amino-7-oxononanoate synthase [Methylococcales bacterium]|mgnify:CR=1 FL=1|jgi:8-amino-7-oxononanoate synthase|nr:8-amino-7-oxononanoate synthase [Methylococcales bacterium]MBT7445352.1 8-amino-7-oxononanoate synthase [Methylococcales bacterium]
MQDLSKSLARLKQQHRYRQVKTRLGPQDHTIEVNGQRLLNFCSNDYLGLSNHPKVLDAFITAAKHYGVGSGASHLINGHTDAHDKLERALAKWSGREKALLYSTGYMANLGIASGLLNAQSAVFEDRLNHASLIDAGLMAKSRFKRFAHLDMQALEKQLSQSEARTKMIMTDGIFSMDGDAAPLAKLSQLAQKYQAWLMVDDAHGVGLLGDTGAGLVEQAQLNSADVPILVYTFGKAIGTSGACVVGDADLIDTLVQHSRSYVYTTAMPPAIAAATEQSIQIIQTETWRKQQLHDNIALFKQLLQEHNISTQSDSAIQPILIGSDENALAASQALNNAGIMVSAIRPPTVPEGTARLRITLSAFHQTTHIEQLVDVLSQIKGLQ